MWIAGGTAVVLALVVVMVYITQNNHANASSSSGSVPTLPTSAPTILGTRCNQTEQLVYHQHAKLDIYVHGRHATVPGFVGIPMDASCYYWIHTHPLTSYPQGVIHMEFPGTKPSPTPTLVRFLHIWRATRPDSDGPVAAILKDGQDVRIYIDQKLYKGTVASVKLLPHELIAIEIGKPYVSPPTFDFKKYGL
jgi:hypothetical protein